MFDFSGYVLRAPRVAPVNAVTTAEPTSGVIRDVRPVPETYTLKSGSPQGEPPQFVDAAADQYRAAVLQAPGSSTVEYLLWAQNTSQLAMVDDPTWFTDQGKGSIPTGEIVVTDATPPEIDAPLPDGYGFFFDGTDRVIVSDNGNRDIGRILYVVVARGDVDDYDDEGWADPDAPGVREGDPPYLVLDIQPADQDPAAGVVRLTANQLSALGGGLSRDRGDRIVEVIYTVAPARFWWTRNDRYEKRFGWNGARQRWEPCRGGAAANLGRLAFDTTYRLAPRFANLPVNAFLPGDADPDAYAMIRLGSTPGAASVPVAAEGAFSGVRVKTDSEVEKGFDFSNDPSVSAVVGQTNGILQFNPRFVREHAGKTIWYIYQGFQADSSGVVGDLRGADARPLFLAPIPGPTDYPILRIDSRRPLRVTLAESEAQLMALSPPLSGEAYVALSTGRIRLSPVDTAKADPTSPNFDKHFLGAQVIYAGVALNQAPQPTRAPVPLLGEDGTPALVTLSNPLFIPNASSLPGLGRSGILDIPDGTGAIPAEPSFEASVRPGGDAVGSPTTGRVRRLSDGHGDTFLFHWKGALERTRVVNSVADLPSAPGFPLSIFSSIEEGTAYVALEPVAIGTTVGSRVELSREDRRKAEGKHVWFIQASVTPATYTTKARVTSRVRKVFRFQGDEVLHVAVDGVYSKWEAASLLAAHPGLDFFTAAQVAASVRSSLSAGTARALNEHVLLESETPGGSVEIGFGDGGVKDLSGAAALGFLPGWRAVEGEENWLPDAGLSLGLFRSPVNLNRRNAVADTNAVARFDGAVIQENAQPNPFVFLDNPPLQDVAGFDENIFFNFVNVVTEGDDVRVISRPLEHFDDIIHRFGQRKFDWVARQSTTGVVQQPTTTLALGQPLVVPESLLGAPGIGGGLYSAADGKSFRLLDADSEYVLPLAGQTGEAQLVERFGKISSSGSRGSFAAGSGVFTDPDATFQTGDRPVKVGYRLKLSSGGSHVVRDVTDDQHLVVDPPFPSASARPTPWEIFEGFSEDVYDPAVVADILYEDFRHLSSEPFQVRVLTPLGVLGSAAMRIPSIEATMSSGRPMSIRFGLGRAETDTSDLVEVTQTKLGVIANDTLDLPESPRLDSGSFRLRLGAEAVTPAGVTLFSDNPGGGSGAEYLTADAVIEGVRVPRGRVKFGAQLLTEYGGAHVWYVEEFEAPGLVPDRTVEYDPVTGDLNFGAGDLATHAGKIVYFVEQMITERRRDVSISPVLGSFSFSTPVQERQIVEVEYYKATTEGRRDGDLVVEFLPVFIKDERATKTGPGTYVFNTTNRTIDQTVEPIVYVGPVQQNFGGEPEMTISYSNGQGVLTFLGRAIADHVPVRVSYAVLEAVGGELAYNASQSPLYRPPFFIQANQDKFGLRGDRTAEFQPGQLLRVGADCFYVRGTRYFTDNDVTSVLIFPPTTREVGSRSPGNDAIAVITNRPATTVVDPDGAEPVQTQAPAGFMQNIPLDMFPFEPVTRGQNRVTFRGDLTQFALPGHILEIGGSPHTITQRRLNEDGSRTTITVSAPFSSSFTVGGKPTVKLSYRPVYPPDSREFLGVGPVLASEPYELVLYGETRGGVTQPGRTLVEGLDYSLDLDTGRVKLLAPNQGALRDDQRVVLSFTRVRGLAPFYSEGALLFPRFLADFLHTTTPSTQNGLLGGQITATYTFEHPDTFYLRIVPMTEFLGEVAERAQREITSQQVSGGPLPTTVGTDNWDYGNLGLLGQRRDLTDKDRGARAFLKFYNAAVIAFEQVQETISGGLVGDRDGKFRFFIGTGKDYPPPGYEDEITGLLNPRLLWNQVFSEARAPLAEIWVTERDLLVEPPTATISNFEISGDFPDADRLTQHILRQRDLVANDVDDRVLARIGRREISLVPFPWFFLFRARGDFRRLGDPGKFSRIFPEATRAFFVTLPGAGANPASGDPGVYTWGRTVNGRDVATRGSPIGQIANPVLGNITNISSVRLQDRRARARVWGYFPNGLAAGALGDIPNPPGAPIPTPAITEPCLVATPLDLGLIPVDPETGFPDKDQLLSQGGTLPDLGTGDPELSTPPFRTGDQIGWGQPDGATYQAHAGQVTSTLLGEDVQKGLFVRDILYGCVIRFQDDAAVPITSPLNVLVGTTPSGGVPADQFPITRGDTVYVVPESGSQTTYNPLSGNLPSTEEQAALLRSSLPSYRIGFDVSVNHVSGEVIDNTYPSFSDPFFLGLKEIFGQNPPLPVSPLEGPVEFAYLGRNPLQIPALLGEARDDSGDIRIPYLKLSNTELDRFEEVQIGVADVMVAQNAALTQYVYPDEIGGVAETVAEAETWQGGSFKEPAALVTSEDVTPRTSGHQRENEPGVGNVGEHDILLVQTDDTASFVPLGAQGILGVGSVESRDLGGGQFGSIIEPPRFVTRTTPPTGPSNSTGSPVRYTLENAAVFVTPPYPADPQVDNSPGVRIIEDTAANLLILDFNESNLTLNDGFTLGVGNFNDIWAASASNKITLRLFARSDPTRVSVPPVTGGDVLLTLEIQGLTLTATPFTGTPIVTVMAGPPVFGTFQGVPDPTIANNRQVFLNVSPGSIPGLSAGVGLENTALIPYQVTDLGGPNQIKTSLYGHEFSLSVDTFVSGTGQSSTAYIGSDRLSFHEVIDLRLAKKRGFSHPLSGSPLETTLVVNEVRVAGAWSTINALANGDAGGGIPIPFTFPRRSSAIGLDEAGGTWEDRPDVGTPERGTLKVPAFEAWGNSPLTIGGNPLEYVRFSAAASSPDERDGSTIFAGDGATESRFSGIANAARHDHRVSVTAISAGSADRVQKGDILVIRESPSADLATTKAGTYLVRHAIPNDAFAGYHEVVASSVAGPGADAGGGWVTSAFPTVLAYDEDTSVLTVARDLWDAFTWGSRVYIVVSQANLASAVGASFIESLLGVDIVSTTTVGDTVEITVDSATFRDADNASVMGDVAAGRIKAGQSLTGMAGLPISVRDGPLPNDTSVVGFRQIPLAADGSIYGFRQLTLTSPSSGPLTLDAFGGTPRIEEGSTPALGNIAVDTEPSVTPHEYHADPDVLVYDEVPRVLTLNLAVTDWKALNDGNGLLATGDGVQCLLPGTQLALTFRALEGVFLEPSFPRSATNLGAAQPHVIDAGHNAADPAPLDDWLREVGMRDFNSYLGTGTLARTDPEPVSFEVRRIRRFHEVSDAIQTALRPLQFAYEIRRGRLTSTPVREPLQHTTIDATGFVMDWETTKPVGAPKASDVWDDGSINTGTNLGPFTDPDVGINPGDEFRVLDASGDVLEKAEVSSVLSDGRLRLAPPGLTAHPDFADYVGMRFEIFLRRAPVPHEQSNEQLLELITDRVVTRTHADYANNLGGYTPEIAPGGTFADAANKLFDDLNADGTSGKTFGALGVRRGDIVLVDPAGKIPRIGGLPATQERGCRPLGDEGILERPAVFTAGGPNPLDDNRGFYRVVSVEEAGGPHLVVSGASEFAGSAGLPSVFPEDSTQRSTYGYSVYPTVNDSDLNKSPHVMPDPGAGNYVEGQADLRPTQVRDPVTQSFGATPYSIRPFSYRVIRPSPLFSEEAVNLVLTMRERMLSLIELFRGPILGRRGGSYYIFQRDRHLDQLPNGTDPELGLGLFTNALAFTMIGRVDVTPFASGSDCLSLLDRRFWVRDRRLDSLTTSGDGVSMKRAEPGDTPYTAFGDPNGSSVLPVLPDRVDLILNQTDRFRDLRYVWLAYRTHRLLGTLAAIRRYDEEFPERRGEQERNLLLQTSLEEVGG